jgi:hypothetical protein
MRVGTAGIPAGNHPIPPPPTEELSGRARRVRRSVPRAKKALALWISFFGLLGSALFIWVTVRGGVAVAFDIVTQHKSPIGSGLGAGGVLLSSFGFFLAPAIIGALVAGAYVGSSRLSAGSIEKRTGEINAGLQSKPRRAGR